MSDPRALVEPLVGHRVEIRLVNRGRRTGVVLGVGDRGFQLSSGIGGKMLFDYGDVDAIEDLGVDREC